MDALIGKTLAGRYEIREKIADGKYSAVYLAWDLVEGRRVALKKPTTNPWDGYYERFQKDCGKLKEICHPGVIAVYDVVVEDGIPLCVMEYVEGETLERHLKVRGKIEWQDAAHFMLQLLSTLNQGYYHYNIYARNVFLLDAKEIKVDFTQSYQIPGSWPEQIEKRFGHRSELYMAGKLLYEMLTGVYPTKLLESAFWQGSVFLPPDAPAVPKALLAVLCKALRKDPEYRYQKSEDMIADLRKVLLNSTPMLCREYSECDAELTKAYQKCRNPFNSGDYDNMLDKLNDEITSKFAAAQSLNKDYQLAVWESEKNIKKLNTEIDTLKRERRELKSKLTKAEQEQEELKRRHQELSNKNNTLRSSNTQVNTRNTSLKAEIDTLTADNKKLQTQNKKLLTEKRNLAAKVRELETTIQQMRESRPVQVTTFFPLNEDEKAALLKQYKTTNQ